MKFLASFALIPFFWVVVGVLLTFISFLLRYAKWHICLSSLNPDISLFLNVRVYLSGLALTASPGKVGETVRAFFLKPYGVSYYQSVGAFIADRGSDVLGVFLLLVVSSYMLEKQVILLSVSFFVFLGGSIFFALFILHIYPEKKEWVSWSKLFGGIIDKFGKTLTYWAKYWSIKNVFLFTIYGGFSYGLQALILYFTCNFMRIPISVAKSIFIYSSSTLLGALSMIPGGVGVMEGSVVVQLMNCGTNETLAIGATMVFRMITLWFGIIIGILSLSSLSHCKDKFMES